MFDVVLVHADFDQRACLPTHPPRVWKVAWRLDIDLPLPLEDVTVLAQPAGEAARIHVSGDPLQPRDAGAGVV